MKHSVHNTSFVSAQHKPRVHKNKKHPCLLITAGPTQEPLDPVRFISNYSTGTFGYLLARQGQKLGYKVTLISGPTALLSPSGVKIIQVKTASQMYEATRRNFSRSDILIMAAAVCDFHPAKFSRQKIKKKGPLGLKLIPTRDILREMGKIKGKRTLVGFALESESLVKNALRKLKDKNLDLIIVNKISSDKDPFGRKTLAPILISRDGRIEKIPFSSKSCLARIILKKIELIS